MTLITRIALGTKFDSDSIDSLLEIIEMTPNAQYAVEVLLGVNKTYTKKELLEMKSPSIKLSTDEVSFNPWTNEVHYMGLREQTVDAYVNKDITNPTVNDIVCLYGSAGKKIYPDIPLYSEYEGNKDVLRHTYVKTGKMDEEAKRCDLSTWCK